MNRSRRNRNLADKRSVSLYVRGRTHDLDLVGADPDLGVRLRNQGVVTLRASGNLSNLALRRIGTCIEDQLNLDLGVAFGLLRKEPGSKQVRGKRRTRS